MLLKEGTVECCRSFVKAKADGYVESGSDGKRLDRDGNICSVALHEA